jgi:hypothetical protein
MDFKLQAHTLFSLNETTTSIQAFLNSFLYTLTIFAIQPFLP